MVLGEHLCGVIYAATYILIFFEVPLLLFVLFSGLSSGTPCIGLARVGSITQTIAHDVLAGICRWEIGNPLHSLVIIGHLHPLEEKILALSNNAHLV